MNKIILVFVFSWAAIAANAQVEKLLGYWAQIDDKTGKEESVFYFFKAADGYYYGNLIHATIPDFENAVCDKCKGEDKGKPLKGLSIFKKLKAEGDKLVGGTATDTRNGKTYYCGMSYEAKTDRLFLKGSLDKAGMLGATKYFSRRRKSAE
jgi:uncharacterized protein (DUF2147 family)